MPAVWDRHGQAKLAEARGEHEFPPGPTAAEARPYESIVAEMAREPTPPIMAKHQASMVEAKEIGLGTAAGPVLN